MFPVLLYQGFYCGVHPSQTYPKTNTTTISAKNHLTSHGQPPIHWPIYTAHLIIEPVCINNPDAHEERLAAHVPATLACLAQLKLVRSYGGCSLFLSKIDTCGLHGVWSGTEEDEGHLAGKHNGHAQADAAAIQIVLQHCLLLLSWFGNQCSKG